jgi:hypothetical protein
LATARAFMEQFDGEVLQSLNGERH